MTVPCTAVIVGFGPKSRCNPIFPSVKISSGWQTAISQSSKGAKILISSLVGVRLESGMLFQVDIIPSVPGYTGVSAEECVALADETLQKEIQQTYPDMLQRLLGPKPICCNCSINN